MNWTKFQIIVCLFLVAEVTKGTTDYKVNQTPVMIIQLAVMTLDRWRQFACSLCRYKTRSSTSTATYKSVCQSDLQWNFSNFIYMFEHFLGSNVHLSFSAAELVMWVTLPLRAAKAPKPISFVSFHLASVGSFDVDCHNVISRLFYSAKRKIQGEEAESLHKFWHNNG